MARKLMVTITREPSDASLDAVKHDLGLRDEEVDSDYGLVAIDPAEHRYAFLVEERASARIAKRPGVEGPFANPQIEPFGPAPRE